MASEGKNHRTIARALNMSRKMARLWRERWLDLKQKDVSIAERLMDAPRSGKPTQLTTEQVLQLFVIACEPPDKYGRPISHWTARELAEEMSKQKIVESISPRHVARLLSEASLKPHLSEYWLNPPPTKNLTRKSKKSVNYIDKQKILEPNKRKSSALMR